MLFKDGETAAQAEKAARPAWPAIPSRGGAELTSRFVEKLEITKGGHFAAREPRPASRCRGGNEDEGSGARNARRAVAGHAGGPIRSMERASMRNLLVPPARRSVRGGAVFALVLAGACVASGREPYESAASPSLERAVALRERACKALAEDRADGVDLFYGAAVEAYGVLVLRGADDDSPAGREAVRLYNDSLGRCLQAASAFGRIDARSRPGDRPGWNHLQGPCADRAPGVRLVAAGLPRCSSIRRSSSRCRASRRGTRGLGWGPSRWPSAWTWTGRRPSWRGSTRSPPRRSSAPTWGPGSARLRPDRVAITWS